MAGPVYNNLVSRLLTANNEILDVQPDALVTELPVHTISFRLVGWFSMVCGALLFVEQYFFRRISCFQPNDFSQPNKAIEEYCWAHGKFNNNRTCLMRQSDGLNFLSTFTHDWMLQAYAYFIIRFFVFALPHLWWGLKYKAYIQCIVKSSADIVKELETLWIQHGEKAESAYRERQEQTDDSKNIISKFKVLKFKHDMVKSLRAIKAMTRDIIQITNHQMQHYRPVLTFVQWRIVLDMLFLSFFVIFDFFLFLICSCYDSSDFYCKVPNGETIRCMTPMMQLLWQLVLLSLLASCFTLLMNVFYFSSLIYDIFSPNLKKCFLHHLPYAELCEDINFKPADRKTYKLLSCFLLRNYTVMKPLNFLESFVKHLEDNRQVHIEILKQALGYSADEAMQSGENEYELDNVKKCEETDLDQVEFQQSGEKVNAWDRLLSTDI